MQVAVSQQHNPRCGERRSAPTSTTHQKLPNRSHAPQPPAANFNIIMDIDKRKLARERYLWDMRSEIDIAEEIGVPYQIIMQWATEERWADQRAALNNQRIQLPDFDNDGNIMPLTPTASDDLLHEHERLVAGAFRQFKILQLQLEKADISELKYLRSRIESQARLCEAMTATIQMHRQVRGIRNTQASTVDMSKKDSGVTYKVTLEPATAPTASDEAA